MPRSRGWGLFRLLGMVDAGCGFVTASAWGARVMVRLSAPEALHYGGVWAYVAQLRSTWGVYSAGFVSCGAISLHTTRKETPLDGVWSDIAPHSCVRAEVTCVVAQSCSALVPLESVVAR